MPNHSLEATANFLQGSPLDSCRLTAATRRMALFNPDLDPREKKKKKKNRSLLRLSRTVPRSASINGTPSPLLCCHSWLQKTLQMWFLRGPDVHGDGLGLFFFFLSFYVLKVLLGSLHCISYTLRLLIIYTEWEKCCLNFHLTKKMLWREK